MYQVCPFKGKSFIINEDHLLTLKNLETKELIDVKLKDYIKWKKYKKHIHKLIKTGCFHWERKQLPISPYLLGVILGDGNITLSPKITTKDKVILKTFKDEIENNFNLKIVKLKCKNRCSSYSFSGTKGKKNKLTLELKKLGLFGKKSGTKFIPSEYKTGSLEQRLQILAGLLDTDGHLDRNKQCYESISKSKVLAEDIAFVALSCGLHASVNKCFKYDQNGNGGKYYRIYISGDINKIPCVIKRKQIKKIKRNSNPLHTGFTLKKLKVDNFYGFVLDKDKRYLLDDFTITHNSGKTFILISALKLIPPKTPVLFITKNAGLVNQNYKQMIQWGIKDVGRWYDGHKEPNYIMCCTAHHDTFKSIKKLIPKFKAIFVDEVHECMSKLCENLYPDLVNAAVRIGISATPFKFDGKDKEHKLKIKGHFGPVFKTDSANNSIITTNELQSRGNLSDSDCTFYNITEPKNIKHEPFIDAVTMGIAENFYFLNIVKQLVNTLSGRSLILVERKTQGEYLKQLLPNAYWIQGKDKLDIREEVFEKLRKDSNAVAIATRHIITAGIDVFLHNLINAAGGQAEHSVIQQMGRGLRKASDKIILRYYDFMFKTNDYLEDHSINRVDILTKEKHKVVVKDIDF